MDAINNRVLEPPHIDLPSVEELGDIRRSIVKRLISDLPVPDPDNQDFLVTAGPPGAGKSHAIDSIVLPQQCVRIDPDVIRDDILKEIKELGFFGDLPEAPGGRITLREVSAIVHDLTMQTTDLFYRACLRKGHSVLLEGTMNWDKIGAQFIEDLQSTPSPVRLLTIIDVEADLETVLAQAKKRWLACLEDDEELGGRFIPPAFIEGLFTGPSAVDTKTATNAKNFAKLAAADATVQAVTLRRFINGREQPPVKTVNPLFS